MSEQKTRVLIDQHGHTLRVVDDEFYALQAERDALAVYCNELFRVLNQLNAQAERALDFDIRNYHALKGASYAADNVLDKTPQQHLADHDAEVSKAAYISGASDYQDADSVHENFDFEDRAEKYAAQLRAKAKP